MDRNGRMEFVISRHLTLDLPIVSRFSLLGNGIKDEPLTLVLYSPILKGPNGVMVGLGV